MQQILTGKRILIIQQRDWARHTGHLLASKLQQEGCRLAALTTKKSTDKFIRAQKEVTYDDITSWDTIVGEPATYLENDDYTLGEITDALGVDSIWPMVASSRNHVKSYGDAYYYSYRQNVPDEAITLYIKALYKYVKRIFEEFRPDIILTPNFTSPHHIMLDLYARKQGIRMITLTDSKVKGVSIFSHSHTSDRGPFLERINDLDGGAETKNRERARTYIEEFRGKFKRPDYDYDYQYLKVKSRPPWLQWIRAELAPYRKIYLWYRRPRINHIPSLGIMRDYRPPRIILRDHYSFKRYKKYAETRPYYALESIGKSVYFPLQFQPEETIDAYAPYFSNQIETARLVAQSLPSDYTLIVKDHPAMLGYRSPSYLEKVARTPNVKLIDHRTPTDMILRKVDLVVSPNSTTLAESAFYNKPAIQLGNLGTTLKLPNVFKHTDMTTLTKRILELLQMSFTTKEYERRLENYVAAAYDVGTELDYVAFWATGKGANPEELWSFYKQEIARVLGGPKLA